MSKKFTTIGIAILIGIGVLGINLLLMRWFPRYREDEVLAYLSPLAFPLYAVIKVMLFDPAMALMEQSEKTEPTNKYLEPIYYDYLLTRSHLRSGLMYFLMGGAVCACGFLFVLRPFYTIASFFLHPFMFNLFYKDLKNVKFVKLSEEGVCTWDQYFLPWNIVSEIKLVESLRGWHLLINTTEGHHSSTNIYYLIGRKKLEKILDGYNLKYIVVKR